jgi:class 3 adenylate cyclase
LVAEPDWDPVGQRPVERTIRALYERQRQHIWTEHGVRRAEMALERAGLLERAESTPAICFVDIAGFTRLTEEQGDDEPLGWQPRSRRS